MGELVIQRHNFEAAKNELRRFSEQTSVNLTLKRVETSKSFGEAVGDFFLGRGIGMKHSVTGDELNTLTSQVQTHLRNVNTTQNKLIREFGQVYSALEALDEDYIKSILISLKATEKTSEGLAATQEDIKKLVDRQQKTLEVLRMFKETLEKYAHLKDVDGMWDSLQEQAESLVASKRSTEELTVRFQEHQKTVDEHLAAMEQTSTAAMEALQKRTDGQDALIQEHQKTVDGKVDEAVRKAGSFGKQIKCAYWIAGGAVCLSVIELVLLLTKVL